MKYCVLESLNLILNDIECTTFLSVSEKDDSKNTSKTNTIFDLLVGIFLNKMEIKVTKNQLFAKPSRYRKW